MTRPPKSDFFINPDDTVIVLRADGTCEASFPEGYDEDDVPEHVVTGAAIMHALEDQELSDLIHENFILYCEAFEYAAEAVNDNFMEKALPPA